MHTRARINLSTATSCARFFFFVYSLCALRLEKQKKKKYANNHLHSMEIDKIQISNTHQSNNTREVIIARYAGTTVVIKTNM